MADIINVEFRKEKQHYIEILQYLNADTSDHNLIVIETLIQYYFEAGVNRAVDYFKELIENSEE